MIVMFTPETITALRKALNLSVSEFAKKMGVCRSTAYYWECGRSHPRYRELVALNEMAKKAGVQIPA